MATGRWLLVLGGVALAACIGRVGSEGGTQALGPESVVRVRTAPVSEAPDHRPVVLHGVTRARERAELALTVGGRVASRPVRVGDMVARGAVLARVDPRPFDNARSTADAAVVDLRARLQSLQLDRGRLEQLERGRTVSESELDRVASEEQSVVASLDAAKASAREAARQRDEAVLLAPFAGVISAVYRQAGESVSPGSPVVQLTGSGGLEVALQVPERIWVELKPGDAAHVELTGIGRAVSAQVAEVARAASPGGLFPVVVSLHSDDAVQAAGLTAVVGLSVPLHAELVVPVGAIVDPTGAGASVFRVHEGIAERVAVEPEALLQDLVAVSGDLFPADAVVVAGQGRLLDGDRVQVVR